MTSGVFRQPLVRNLGTGQCDPMLVSLALPAIILMIAAVAAARALERLMPESLLGLALTFVLSAVLTWALASGLFALLYYWRGASLATTLGEAEGWRHMAGLGLKAAVIWAPLLALTVATAPRRWRHNVW
ncbi:hypothetical protein [Pacificoceanicola onchidii]|uniref:hypothetical protein n=1 Tax=Pacificoceanicola onchidii TaxID=2562685 RepID=UPI0010A629EC|nr:hypothetical protein [Pacificoceanicola onchidii]